MARKALIVKQRKLAELRDKCWKEGKKMPRPTRFYNRCQVTGKTRWYVRDFGVSRVALRKYAREGIIMGLKKASR